MERETKVFNNIIECIRKLKYNLDYDLNKIRQKYGFKRLISKSFISALSKTSLYNKIVEIIGILEMLLVNKNNTIQYFKFTNYLLSYFSELEDDAEELIHMQFNGIDNFLKIIYNIQNFALNLVYTNNDDIFNTPEYSELVNEIKNFIEYFEKFIGK